MLEVASFGTVRTEHFTEGNEFIIVPGQWDVLHESLASPIFFPSLHPTFNYQQEKRYRGLGWVVDIWETVYNWLPSGILIPKLPTSWSLSSTWSKREVAGPR